MTIDSYASLQQAVADTLVRDDLLTFVPMFIQGCENKLYRSLKIRNMETALSVTTSSGIATVPTRYLELKYAYLDVSPSVPLQVVQAQDIYEQYPNRGAGGEPHLIAREGSNFIFGPFPGQEYTVKGIYYRYYQPLRTADLNWYVTNAPHVLLYGSLLEAQAFIMGDERIGIWQSMYADAIAQLKAEARDELRSSSYLMARPG